MPLKRLLVQDGNLGAHTDAHSHVNVVAISVTASTKSRRFYVPFQALRKRSPFPLDSNRMRANQMCISNARQETRRSDFFRWRQCERVGGWDMQDDEMGVKDPLR